MRQRRHRRDAAIETTMFSSSFFFFSASFSLSVALLEPERGEKTPHRFQPPPYEAIDEERERIEESFSKVE